MSTIAAPQGSEAWLAHRRRYRNASDTPAVLGISPHKTRAQLLHELATGILPEHSEFQERVLASGHAVEALARPIAEDIIGDELYPETHINGRWSASLDGITLDCVTVWEHKRLNARLRDVFANGEHLPEHYRAQMEHQLMCCAKSEQALFMASEWSADDQLIEQHHRWYQPDPELRARIVAAWEQFEVDLAAYVAPVAEAAPVVRPMDRLPALLIQITGTVLANNLPAYRDAAVEAFRSINTDLQSDEDFAEGEAAVKFCGDVETRIEAAKQHALSQTQSIDALFAALDSIKGEARAKRLTLERLIAERKVQIKVDIVAAAAAGVLEHYAAINATLGEHAISVSHSLRQDIGAALKGLRTVSSCRAAADKVAADMKISASQTADRIRACIAVLGEFPDLAVPDRVALCAAKLPEDLRHALAHRAAEQKRKDEARAEAIRQQTIEDERKRAEEAARVAAPAVRVVPDPAPAPAIAPTAAASSYAQSVQTPAPTVGVVSANSPQTPATWVPTAPAAAVAPRIKLGDINSRIAPLSISAEGLAKLGFDSVGNSGASKLYDSTRLPAMLQAMARHLLHADRVAA